MKKHLIILALFVSTITVFEQDVPKTAIGKPGTNPIFIIDSQKVNQSDLSKYEPDSIANIVILYDTSAIKMTS